MLLGGKTISWEGLGTGGAMNVREAWVDGHTRCGPLLLGFATRYCSGKGFACDIDGLMSIQVVSLLNC